MIRPTRQAWKGSYPLFILKLNWNGRTFYCSTKPMIIDFNSEPLQLDGGLLEEPDFNQTLPELGFQINSYSTPIAVYLKNVNIALLASQNNTLENASAELSYILINDEGTQSFENRIILIKGLIKEPIYGHTDRKEGYFEASIEVPVLQTSLHNTAVGSQARVSPEELSDLVNSSSSPLSAIQNAYGILELVEVHKEKVIPIIFGEAGKTFDFDMNVINYGATPAYVLYAQSGTTNHIYLCIASHDVEAGRVRIFDDLGNNRIEPVKKWIRSDGNIFCYVEFTHSSGTFQNPIDDESARYFCSWYSGGGLISSSDNTSITGAGDICLWCLEQGNQEIDYGSWEGIKSFLNSYKIAGYVNNEEVSPIQFLEDEIIPLLPISVVQGTKGIKPVLDLFASGVRPNALCSILASPEFKASSAIQQNGDTSSLINDITVLFCFDMKQQAYKSKQRITGNELFNDNKVNTNDIAVKSFQKYGNRAKTLETSFVHDIDTASLICFDIIRNNAFPNLIVEYICSPRFGWIEVGDILSLTDSDLNLTNKLVQVISKSWKNTNWTITFKLSP